MSTPSGAAAPLEGLRVLDLATMLAGPYAATLLGDLGADVIKVESHYGDDSRHLGPERDGQRSPFLSLNRNKRGLVLDLTRPAAGVIFARLAKSADVLITNVLVVDWTGIYKADVGIKHGRIVGIGNAGNPDVMPNITPGMVFGVTTEAIAGEGLILTAGAIDAHIHFICP